MNKKEKKFIPQINQIPYINKDYKKKFNNLKKEKIEKENKESQFLEKLKKIKEKYQK